MSDELMICVKKENIVQFLFCAAQLSNQILMDKTSRCTYGYLNDLRGQKAILQNAIPYKING